MNFSSASGDDVPIIGLPMWDEIRETDKLRLDHTSTGLHTHITTEMQRQEDSTEKKCLDPYHKYFLIIDGHDDGGETLDGWKGYQFRHDFQNYVTTKGGDPR